MPQLTIRRLRAADAAPIAAAFVGWNKLPAQYEKYDAENREGWRITLVALHDEAVVGYGNLLTASYHEPFRAAGIPEINDLNVIPPLQGTGIGRALIAALEDVARALGYARIGIGVVLTPDYAKAQRLYPRLGYAPDGDGPKQTDEGPETHFIKSLGEAPRSGT